MEVDAVSIFRYNIPMKDSITLPSNIAKLLGSQTYKLDNLGLSNATVYMFDNEVLKVQPHSLISDNEYRMLQFFNQRNLAPKVLAREVVGETDYLLMEKCRGKVLCDSEILLNPCKLTEIASEVLHKMWGMDIATCPRNITLDKKLKLAEYNVANNLVDLDNVQPDTFGANGRFQTPEKLLQWLYDNKPNENLVVTHGDFCLPNILWDGKRAEIIDVVWGGVGDRYQDIALLYRSLKDNLNGGYGTYYGELDKDMFFSTLGITPDWDKIDYYVMLDELF